MIRVDEAKFHSPIHSTFGALVVGRVVGYWCEELSHFWSPVPTEGIAVLMHLIYLLSILLRWNYLTRIQKAVVDQTGSRIPNSDQDLFFGASLAFSSALELLSPTTMLVITGYHVTIHFSLHITIQLRNDLLLLCRR